MTLPLLYTLTTNIWNKVQAIWSVHADNNSILNEIRQNQQRFHQEEMALLDKILEAITPLPAFSVRFDVTVEGQSTQEGATSVVIKDNQQFTISLSFLDTRGNPAKIQPGSVVFSSFAGLTVTPDTSDETKALAVADGAIASGQVSASADADLGEGTQTITGVLEVEIVAGNATVVQLNTEAPVDQSGVARRRA